MNYQLVPGFDVPVIECTAGITDSRGAMELAYACSDADTDRLLIAGSAFPPEFFQLRTGLAGEWVQTLVNFRLRTAVVFAPDAPYPDRFREFLLEARGNRNFRAFDSRDDALEWLAAVGAA